MQNRKRSETIKMYNFTAKYFFVSRSFAIQIIVANVISVLMIILQISYQREEILNSSFDNVET